MNIFERLMANEKFYFAIDLIKGITPSRIGKLDDLTDGVQPEFIVINNVADFCGERPVDFEGFDAMKDFPNIAPPWPISFFQYTKRNNQEKIPFGVLVCASKVSNSHAPASREKGVWFGDKTEIGWVLACHLFQINSLGKIVMFGPFPVIASPAGQIIDPVRDPGASDRARRIFGAETVYLCGFHPVLLAISLTHCKNTEIECVVPDEKLARAQLKRHGVPRLSYGVIKIQPMVKILREKGEMASGASLRTALHICRGHFKDYRERGLFGKNKGLYWWNMAVRGDINDGLAVRDYSIEPPADPHA